MRAVGIVVAVFALLAFDLVHNNGHWLSLANDLLREVRDGFYGWLAMLDLQIRLQEADRRISEWRTLIATQKRRIAELHNAGHSAAGSIVLLRELEGSLSSMRGDRDAIARKIERKRRVIGVTETAPTAATQR
jgi:hypothetical protein